MSFRGRLAIGVLSALLILLSACQPAPAQPTSAPTSQLPLAADPSPEPPSDATTAPRPTALATEPAATASSPSAGLTEATPVAPATAAAPNPATSAPPGSTAARGRVVLGYYVPYDSTSWSTLEMQGHNLSFVAAQWASIDACGSIGSRDNRTLNAFARARSVGVLPSLLTMDQALNHRLLTDEPTRDRAVNQIASYVVEEGYAGFDLDLENVPAGDRAAYTAFVARLSSALRAREKLLIAALPAKRYDATSGWAGAFDYAALAPYLDYAMIMSYAYTTASSSPGSTAPLDWVDRVMAYVTSQIPPEKVLLGLAFYGYDWNTTVGGGAKALRYSQAAALARYHGVSIHLDPASRSATFSYTAKAGDAPPPAAPLPAPEHEIVERKQPPCARPLPTMTPAPPRPTATARPTPTPAPVQQHVVWLEDAASIAERLAVADRYGVAGAGAWRLGQEDPAVWPLLNSWRRGGR